ncbi:MAG: NADH-quinone oxidoreductase subunit C [Verrucomicrobiia bacterium]
MGNIELLKIKNIESAELGSVPVLGIKDFRSTVVEYVSKGGRLSSFFAAPLDNRIRFFAILSNDADGYVEIISAIAENTFESLTPDVPSAHLFEREIYEQFGIIPEGHPRLKPVRFQNKVYNRISGKYVESKKICGVADFFEVKGEEIHEVAVGPVHAGIIEPGHFRFQCFGEVVLNLEILLGYQHRGIERNLIGGPDERTIYYMEAVAGDTTIGHTLAYCQAIESLAGVNATSRGQALRAVALELERLANHTGDLGALANDVGFLPTASFCGRLRGDFLNMTALLCGSRFGRGFIRPGGVTFDLLPDKTGQLVDKIKKTYEHVEGAVNLLWNTSSVRARFENVGFLSREECIKFGIVGPAARAGGLEIDVRRDHPFGQYCFSQIPVSTHLAGNVFARAYVRWLEIKRSAEFLIEILSAIPPENIRTKPPKQLARNAIVVSLVEGWRGEICHTVITDKNGRIAYYKIVDPSFHNWTGLELAMRNQQISDFPLCNKSFNLSYCGFDL